MKRLSAFVVPALLLAVLVGCPGPLGFMPAPGETALPADSVNDSARSVGIFTFETLFPVRVELDIDLYDVDAEGRILPDPLPPGTAEVRISLTDVRGLPLYQGTAAEDGTLAATVYLPSAPEPVTLTLLADGFEDRTVVIGNMVEYEKIDRSLAMKRGDMASRSAPRTFSLSTAPVTGSALKVPTVTVAFEDLFGKARAGDADYNDFLASYDITETMDGEGRVLRIDVEARAVRKWAGYNHAFGIRIDSFEGTASLSGELVSITGQTVPFHRSVRMPAEIPLFLWSASAVGKTARFTLEFDVPQSVPQSLAAETAAAALSRPPYNPYLFVHNTLHDIHLISREPLSLSRNPDDDFVDAEGFPWALLVPTEWESPAEGQRIEEAYPRFENWRVSGGTEHTDWYNYPGEPWEPSKAIVYVAGSYKSGFQDTAAYWKDDGTAVTRVDLPAAGPSEALDIAIDGDGGLYFAGYSAGLSGDTAVYWRNGTRVDLREGGRATGIAVSGGAVYVSGYFFDGLEYVAAYWKDDGTVVTRVDLSADGENARATDIGVDTSGAVYVSGYYSTGTHDIAAYWQDSGAGTIRTDLYTTGLAQANGLALSGTDVHVAGRYLDGSVWAAVWKNDPAGLRPLDSRSANAKAITVLDGAPMAVGDYLGTGYIRRAAMWRIGSTVELTTLDGEGDNPAFANGLTVLDGDVYVAGIQVQGFDQAVYWRNGTLKQLSPDTESRANALAAVSQQ